MSKSKSAKRKAKTALYEQRDVKKVKSSEPLTPPSDGPNIDAPTRLGLVVPEDELEITIETLQSLTKHPSLIKSKACKDLRVAVYDFRQACTTGVNNASSGGECRPARTKARH